MNRAAVSHLGITEAYWQFFRSQNWKLFAEYVDLKSGQTKVWKLLCLDRQASAYQHPCPKVMAFTSQGRLKDEKNIVIQVPWIVESRMCIRKELVSVTHATCKLTYRCVSHEYLLLLKETSVNDNVRFDTLHSSCWAAGSFALLASRAEHKNEFVLLAQLIADQWSVDVLDFVGIWLGLCVTSSFKKDVNYIAKDHNTTLHFA